MGNAEVSTFSFGVTELQKSSVQNKIVTTRQLVSELGKLVDLTADGIFDQVAFSVVYDGLIHRICTDSD